MTVNKDFVRTDQFIRVKTNKLVHVLDGNGNECLVAEQDFDPSVHTPYDDVEVEVDGDVDPPEDDDEDDDEG